MKLIISLEIECYVVKEFVLKFSGMGVEFEEVK